MTQQLDSHGKPQSQTVPDKCECVYILNYSYSNDHLSTLALIFKYCQNLLPLDLGDPIGVHGIKLKVLLTTYVACNPAMYLRICTYVQHLCTEFNYTHS